MSYRDTAYLKLYLKKSCMYTIHVQNKNSLFPRQNIFQFQRERNSENSIENSTLYMISKKDSIT